MPAHTLAIDCSSAAAPIEVSYPHGRVQSACDLIVLLQPRAASQDLWQPELADGALHVSNLALGRLRCLDPLRGLSAHTAYHVRMRERLGRPLIGLGAQLRGNWLRDARVEGGGSAGHHERVVPMVAQRPLGAFAIASQRSSEEGARVSESQ